MVVIVVVSKGRGGDGYGSSGVKLDGGVASMTWWWLSGGGNSGSRSKMVMAEGQLIVAVYLSLCIKISCSVKIILKTSILSDFDPFMGLTLMRTESKMGSFARGGGSMSPPPLKFH